MLHIHIYNHSNPRAVAGGGGGAAAATAVVVVDSTRLDSLSSISHSN